MERRQRDLRGADQEQLVAGDLVDHLPLAGEEAGAVERALADEHRRDHRHEPLARRPARSRSAPGPARPAPGRPAGRRSASPRPRAAFSISIQPLARPRSRWSRISNSNSGRSPTSRKTTASSSVSRPAPPAPEGWAASDMSSSRFASTSASSASSSLHLGAHLAHLGDHGLGVLAGALRRRRSIGGAVLPRPPLLDLGQQLPAALVEAQQLVERLGGAAARQRGPRGLGILADARRSSISGPRGPGARLRGSPTRRPVAEARRPRGRRTRRRTRRRCLASVADDDVLGHDRAREAAVSDREQDVVEALGALVEVRALVRGAPGWRCPACPRASACDSPSSAPRTAPRRDGRDRPRHRDPLGPAGGEDQGRRGCRCEREDGRARGRVGSRGQARGRHHTFRFVTASLAP